MANKRALIVGINYPGTDSELRGCVNDANNMEALLMSQFGFTDVVKIVDNAATTAAIMAGLRNLVDGAMPGDTLVFHYSGHGSQVFDRNGDEADRFDEIICPVDLDWRDKVITDDQMKAVFDTVPAGVNLTVILDCCHSGSGLDQANAYQPLGLGEARTIGDGGRYLAPPAEMLAEMQAAAAMPKLRSVQSRNVNSTAMLITGCQANQTSADAFIDGTFQGAATYSLLRALETNADTYRSVIVSMNNFMVSQGYTQRPELNGPEALFDNKFLLPVTNAAPLTDGNGAVSAPITLEATETDDNKTSAIMLFVIVAVIVFVLFA